MTESNEERASEHSAAKPARIGGLVLVLLLLLGVAVLLLAGKQLLSVSGGYFDHPGPAEVSPAALNQYEPAASSTTDKSKRAN